MTDIDAMHLTVMKLGRRQGTESYFQNQRFGSYFFLKAVKETLFPAFYHEMSVPVIFHLWYLIMAVKENQ